MMNWMKKTMKKKKGFTLTELIVVVAILGVLAAVATPAVLGYIDQARVETDNANAKIIENTLLRIAASDPTTLTFDASATYTSAELVTIISSELSEVPDVQQSGMAFFVNLETGRVTIDATGTVTAGLVELV